MSNDERANGHASPPRPQLVVTFEAPGSASFQMQTLGDVHPMQLAAVIAVLQVQVEACAMALLQAQGPRVVTPPRLVPRV